MKFVTSPVTIPLYGHGLEAVGSVSTEPQVTGTFAEDPVTGNDGAAYGVFTITDSETGAYPSLWAGTYRINASRLKADAPHVIASL